jgi:hypothetical protein
MSTPLAQLSFYEYETHFECHQNFCFILLQSPSCLFTAGLFKGFLFSCPRVLSCAQFSPAA